MTIVSLVIIQNVYPQVDVAAAFSVAMAPKEDPELSLIRKASSATSEVFSKYLKEQIMDVIDNDRKVKHSKLAEGVEKALTDKKYVPNLDTSQVGYVLSNLVS